MYETPYAGKSGEVMNKEAAVEQGCIVPLHGGRVSEVGRTESKGGCSFGGESLGTCRVAFERLA